METKELFLENGKSAGVFACGKCKLICASSELADKCCDWKCVDCSVGVRNYTTRCDSCHSKVMLDRRAALLEKAQIVEDYDGWVCCDECSGGQDGYFPSLEEFVDYIFDEAWGDPEVEGSPEWPEFVFACKSDVKELDVGNSIENMCEGGYEEMEEGLRGKDELYAAVDKFNELNRDALTCWEVDYKRKVRVPERLNW
jgi:hypothetical protein